MKAIIKDNALLLVAPLKGPGEEGAFTVLAACLPDAVLSQMESTLNEMFEEERKELSALVRSTLRVPGWTHADVAVLIERASLAPPQKESVEQGYAKLAPLAVELCELSEQLLASTSVLIPDRGFNAGEWAAKVRMVTKQLKELL